VKKIALTQRLVEHEGYKETRDALDIRWGELCKRLGFLPIPLPASYDFKYYFSELGMDGLILTGGNDLASQSDNELSRKRDLFERSLIEFSIAQGVPILGVCRGMQVLAEYFGGEQEDVVGHVSTRHALVVSSESRYGSHLKELSTVNSYHNYALKGAPDDFIVSATSAEGVIEAVEHKSLRVFAQMWHSEREEPFSERELQLIGKFFD